MSKTKVVMFSDIVEENGKTIRENNLEKQHKYQVGDLVEVELSEWHGEGWRTQDRDEENMSMGQKIYHKVVGGIPEESLTKIEVNEALKEGYASLSWDKLFLRYHVRASDILNGISDDKTPQELGFLDSSEIVHLLDSIQNKAWTISVPLRAKLEQWGWKDRTKKGLMELIKETKDEENS